MIYVDKYVKIHLKGYRLQQIIINNMNRTDTEVAETGFLTSEPLSQRHQDLLQISPLIRKYCAETLLTREQEQALFQKLDDRNRELFALMLRITRVRESVIALLNRQQVESAPHQRLGSQLRGLCNRGVLEIPLSTDAYLEFIEDMISKELEQINQCQDSREQIQRISRIILHPVLLDEVRALYRRSYQQIDAPTKAAIENHRHIERQEKRIEKLKEELVRHNLRLVIKHAAVYAKHHLDIHDLIQEGTLGLMRACDLYDYRRGYKFSTYASRWILQTILNLLNEINFTIQVPRNISQAYRKVHHYIDEAVTRSGISPSAAEIAHQLEMDEKEVEAILHATWVTSSLNTPLTHAEESDELQDLLEEPEDDYEKIDLFMQYRVVKQWIEAIPSERDREILKRRYAIGYSESTLSDIADEYGLTKERIRQIINQQVKKMREQLAG